MFDRKFHFPLSTFHFPIFTFQFPLSNFHFPLFIAHCILPIAIALKQSINYSKTKGTAKIETVPFSFDVLIN